MNMKLGTLKLLSFLVMSLGLEVDSKTPEQLVAEWLTKEKSFMKDMDKCLEYFKKPMTGEGSLIFDGYGTVQSQLDQVFGPVEKFIDSQKANNPLYKFAENFRGREDEGEEEGTSFVSPDADQMTKAFTELRDTLTGELSEKFVELYSDYMIAHKMMGPLSAQPEWNNYYNALQQQKQNLQQQTWNVRLDALLVKPVQKLMHYSAYFEELKTLTTSSSAKKEIMEALQVIKEASSECNERVRAAETENAKKPLRSLFEGDVLVKFGKWIDSFELNAKENSFFGKKPLPCLLHIFANYVVLLITDTEKGRTNATKFPADKVEFSYAAKEEILRLEYNGTTDAGKKLKLVYSLMPKGKNGWTGVLRAIKNALTTMRAEKKEMELVQIHSVPSVTK